MNSNPEAIPMEKLAESLGIPAKAIHLEIHSDDTYTEAQNVLPLVGHKPFILVTSAYHMPRSVGLFHFSILACTQFRRQPTTLARQILSLFYYEFCPGSLRLYSQQRLGTKGWA